MKILTSFLTAGLLCAAFFSASAYEKLSWEYKTLSAGKVDLSTQGYTLTHGLGTPGFSTEFDIPIQLVYDSISNKRNAFGDAWRCPQLESRVFPRDNNGAEWLTPWGESVSFFKKERPDKDAPEVYYKDKMKGSGLYSPYSDWEAKGSKGDWTISGLNKKQGWSFVYRHSLLQEITAPSGRKLYFDYSGKKLVRIKQNNRIFVELEYNKEPDAPRAERLGTLAKLTINDETFSFEYKNVKVPVLPDKLGQGVTEVNRILLTGIKREKAPEANATSHRLNGTFTSPQRNDDCGRAGWTFEYDDHGYLCKVKRGDYTEELVTESETLGQRISFLKQIAEAEKKGLNIRNILPAKVCGRLLKDRQYEYSYPDKKIVFLKNRKGETAVYNYDELRGILKVTDFSGEKHTLFWFRRYDVAYNGRLRLILDHKERTVLRCRYDKKTGMLIKSADMAENETYYKYDKNLNLILVSRTEDNSENPIRPLTAIKYDSRANPVLIERLGRDGKPIYGVKLKYDNFNQPEAVETPESQYKFSYNEFGRLTKVTDTFGRTTLRNYDKYNRLESVISDNGICVVYEYDSGCRLAGIKKFSSDKKSELFSSVNFVYDSLGNLISVTDHKGRTRKFDRDAEGKMTAEYYPDESVVRYAFDELGRLSEVLDQNNNPIRFTWNSFGKLDSRITAERQVVDYDYDSSGLLKSVSKYFDMPPKTVVSLISYEYDDCDRLSTVHYHGEGRTKSFKYDSYGKTLRVETVEQNIRDTSSHIDKDIRSVDYVYDEFDRVAKKTITRSVIPYRHYKSEAKEETLTYEYTYTPSGKRKAVLVQYPDGSQKVTQRVYDKYGRLTGITDNGKEVAYAYDKNSSLSEKMLPGGLFESYEYDKEGRLLCKTLNSRTVEQGTAEPQNSGEKSRKSIASLKYFYDADGTLTAREVNGKLQTYEYDLKGQLIATKDREGNILEKYEYDPAGNILKKIVNGKETIFSYDRANQLAASKSTAVEEDGLGSSRKIINPKSEIINYRYDAAGRLISENSTDSTLLTASTKSYTYGWLDKVVQTTEDGGLITDGGRLTTDFSYYPDGQLAERHNKDSEESFVWDGLSLIKRNSVNYTIEPHVNGGSPILTTENTDHTEVLFNDMLGSSLGSVENGTFAEISRTSFGESFVPLAASREDFFTGKPNVEGLGYAFLFRNYRSELGKWQTSDPLGYPDGWNNLAYCNNWVTTCYDWLGADIYHIVDSEAAVNNGHSAAIIGDDDRGYTFISYLPADLTGGEGTGRNLETGHFDTLTEAVEYAQQTRTDAGKTPYDKAQMWETDADQDQKALQAANDFVSSDWIWNEHNCWHMFADAILPAANPGSGYDASLMKPLPNVAFELNEKYTKSVELPE